MSDKEYEFCLKLHNRLKDYIKPSVFVTIQENGKLNIIMYDKIYGIRYEWCLNKFGERLKNSDDSTINTDVISRSVVKDYRKFLLNKFLKNENERGN